MFSFCLPVLAAADDSSISEVAIASQIEQEKKLIFSEVYRQLAEQDALILFDTYVEILTPEIETQILAQHGISPASTTASYTLTKGVSTMIDDRTYRTLTRCFCALFGLFQLVFMVYCVPLRAVPGLPPAAFFYTLSHEEWTALVANTDPFVQTAQQVCGIAYTAALWGGGTFLVLFLCRRARGRRGLLYRAAVLGGAGLLYLPTWYSIRYLAPCFLAFMTLVPTEFLWLALLGLTLEERLCPFP